MMTMPLFAAALLAAPAADRALPGRAQLQEALNDLEKCRGLTGPECRSPERRYTVHGAKCAAIPPEEGRRSVACRVDMTLTYADPSQEEATRYHDSCLRFAELEGSGSPRRWTVVQVRDRPCEMPSALKRDPNRLPNRGAVERALVAGYTCRDFDGITDCGDQPESASVGDFRCRPIAPAEDADFRVACRVTADVRFSGRTRPLRLRHACVYLERITPADESPSRWFAGYVPDKARCEVR